ncbi:MAG: 2OG-Fe(II) oxygenase family protein [Acidobacteriota bacterium]
MNARKTKKEGIDATNRDYLRYDQVEKKQTYRFAEADGAEEFDEEFQVRTCDISGVLDGDPAAPARFAEELGRGLREIGFAILSGHGIDPGIYSRAEAAAQRIFEAHTLDEKMGFAARRHGSVNEGYFPIEETTDIHPDLVEGWVFGRRAFDLADGRQQPCDVAAFWPDTAAEADLRQVYLAQEKLILPIMQAMLTSLGSDPHLYDERLTGPKFAIRLNYYPPVEAARTASGAGRLLGHEDVTMFTLLPAPRVEGLQALNRRNMSWVRLQAPPGTIILNTGDYMQRISNDILPSTTHRVSQPQDAALRNTVRISLPMNVYLREDELLEVLAGLPDPKYPPIRAIEFHTRTTAKYYGDDYAVD